MNDSKMVKSTRLSRKCAAICAAILTSLAIVVPTASATNLGTTSGVMTPSNSCSVSWVAASVMDSDLTNDDPNYPGLMVDLDGNPMPGGNGAFTNGGYIQEVNPAYGHPGYLELTHFYLGDTQQVWRPVIASEKPMSNVQATFTLPEQVRSNLSNYSISLDVQSANAKIGAWGGTYGDYAWEAMDPSQVVDNGDGTITANIGNLEAMHGTVFQIVITSNVGNFVKTDQFVTTAALTGTYPDSECPELIAPEPAPADPESTEPEETKPETEEPKDSEPAIPSDETTSPVAPHADEPAAQPEETAVLGHSTAVPTAPAAAGVSDATMPVNNELTLANTGVEVRTSLLIALALIISGATIMMLRRRSHG